MWTGKPTPIISADYALRVGMKMVAMIEAKASYKDISATMNCQCKDYTCNIIAAKKEIGHGNWGDWLQKEFQWNARTVRYFMSVAQRFGNRNTYSDLKSSTLKAMLELPVGDEEKFVEEQKSAGTPLEEQSARQVQESDGNYRTACRRPKL